MKTCKCAWTLWCHVARLNLTSMDWGPCLRVVDLLSSTWEEPIQYQSKPVFSGSNIAGKTAAGRYSVSQTIALYQWLLFFSTAGCDCVLYMFRHSVHCLNTFTSLVVYLRVYLLYFLFAFLWLCVCVCVSAMQTWDHAKQWLCFSPQTNAVSVWNEPIPLLECEFNRVRMLVLLLLSCELQGLSCEIRPALSPSKAFFTLTMCVFFSKHIVRNIKWTWTTVSCLTSLVFVYLKRMCVCPRFVYFQFLVSE